MSNSAFVSTAEAARILNVNVSTLKVWRVRGTGPRFRRWGRLIRYHLDDLEDFAGCPLTASASGGVRPERKTSDDSG